MLASTFGGGGALQAVLGIIAGLLVMIVGPFVLRIVYESAIVIFRIYDTLSEIRDVFKDSPP
jgi:hypothetical protein